MCPFEGPRLQKNTTKNPREDPQRERKEQTWSGRGKKKKNRRNVGAPSCGPHAAGVHVSGSTLRAEALRAPAGLGPLRFSFYHIAHLFFVHF